MDAMDIARLTDALALEERARKSVVRLTGEFRAIYNERGKLTDQESKKVRRAVRKWMRAAKTVANVIGEQMPED